MKIFSIDCSCGGEGITSKLLSAFLDGLKENNIEISEYSTGDLIINPCRECTNEIDFEYSDKCRCDDDMNNLYPVFRESQIWIFAAPITKNGSFKYIKNLMDRMEPLFQPTFFADSGPVALVAPEIEKNGKIFFLTVVEDEQENKLKEALSEFDSFAFLFNKEFGGAMIKNSSLELLELFNIGKADNLLAKFKNAGAELAQTGEISKDTIQQINNN